MNKNLKMNKNITYDKESDCLYIETNKCKHDIKKTLELTEGVYIDYGQLSHHKGRA